jgi:hypothetical protein
LLCVPARGEKGLWTLGAIYRKVTPWPYLTAEFVSFSLTAEFVSFSRKFRMLSDSRFFCARGELKLKRRVPSPHGLSTKQNSKN